jgi:hypothetical protein
MGIDFIEITYKLIKKYYVINGPIYEDKFSS